jgi:hypothetical protein
MIITLARGVELKELADKSYKVRMDARSDIYVHMTQLDPTNKLLLLQQCVDQYNNTKDIEFQYNLLFVIRETFYSIHFEQILKESRTLREHDVYYCDDQLILKDTYTALKSMFSDFKVENKLSNLKPE